MISNSMIVDGMKEALKVAFTTWLDENKDAVLQIISSSIADKTKGDKDEKPSEKTASNFLTANQLATRWHFHSGSVLRMLRLGILPTVRIGRRILVPLAAVEDYEKGTMLDRRR